MKGRKLLSIMALALGSLTALLVVAGGREVIASTQPEPATSETSALTPISPEQREALRRAHLMDTFTFGDDKARLWAAGQIVEQDADWPDDYRGAFFHALAPGALVAAYEHQIPPSITLAQAAQERGWGRSSLAKNYNNLFGVKATSDLPSVTLNSAEIRNGQRVPTRASFAVFESWEDAVEQHGELLAHPRYNRARDNWTDWERFITLIAPMYASDPRYVSRVSTLVRSYDLDRWDHLIVESVDMASTAPDRQALADSFEADERQDERQDAGYTGDIQ